MTDAETKLIIWFPLFIYGVYALVAAFSESVTLLPNTWLEAGVLGLLIFLALLRGYMIGRRVRAAERG